MPLVGPWAAVYCITLIFTFVSLMASEAHKVVVALERMQGVTVSCPFLFSLLPSCSRSMASMSTVRPKLFSVYISG